MKKLSFIDVLRVMSFAVIIFYHFAIDLEVKGIYNFQKFGITFFNSNMNIVILSVSLFFIISGACLTLSVQKQKNVNWLSFYKKRITRILIPFYLAYIFDLFLEFMQYRVLPFPNDIPLWRVIFTFAGVDEYFTMLGTTTFSLGIGEWFLGCLIMMYLIFPLLYTCMKKNRYVTILAATIYYIVLILTYNYNVPQHMNFFSKIYEFILGMFLILELNKIKKWSLVITLPIIAVCFLGKPYIPVPQAFMNILLSGAVFCFAALCEDFISNRKHLLNILRVVSKYSFEVYLIHHFIIYWFSWYFTGHLFCGREIILLLTLECFVMAVGARVLKKYSVKVENWIGNIKLGS